MVTAEEYGKFVAFLDYLIDEVGEDEPHSLASLIDEIGRLIETYEDTNVPEIDES